MVPVAAKRVNERRPVGQRCRILVTPRSADGSNRARAP